MLRRTGIITPLCQSSLSALLSSACAPAARVSVNLQCYRFKAWHAYRHIDIDAVRVERQGVTAGMGIRVHDFRHRPAVSSSTSVHNSADKRGRTAESVSHATTHATSHDMQTGHRRRRVSPPPTKTSTYLGAMRRGSIAEFPPCQQPKPVNHGRRPCTATCASAHLDGRHGYTAHGCRVDAHKHTRNTLPETLSRRLHRTTQNLEGCARACTHYSRSGDDQVATPTMLDLKRQQDTVGGAVHSPVLPVGRTAIRATNTECPCTDVRDCAALSWR